MSIWRQSARCDSVSLGRHGRLWLLLLLELRLLQPSPNQPQELLHRGYRYWPSGEQGPAVTFMVTSFLSPILALQSPNHQIMAPASGNCPSDHLL